MTSQHLQTFRQALFKLFSLSSMNYVTVVITAIVISRLNSPSTIGEVAMWVFTIELLAIVADLGIGHQAIQGRFDLRSRGSSLLVVTLLTWIMLIFGVPVLWALYEAHLPFLLAMLIFKCISVQYSIHSATAYLLGLFTLEAKINFLLTMISGAAAIAVALSPLEDSGYLALTIVYCGPKLSSLFLSFNLKEKIQMRFDRSLVKGLFSNGLLLVPNNLTLRMKIHFERFLLGSFYDFAVVGFTLRARTFTDALPNLIFNTSRQLLIKSLADVDKTEQKSRFFEQALAPVFIGVSWALLVILFFAEPIILTLLGPAWERSIGMVGVFMPLVLTNMLLNYEKTFIFSAGKNKRTAVVTSFEILSYTFAFLLASILETRAELAILGATSFLLVIGALCVYTRLRSSGHKATVKTLGPLIYLGIALVGEGLGILGVLGLNIRISMYVLMLTSISFYYFMDSER